MVYSAIPANSPLDAAIQALQFMLHEELSDAWDLGDDRYQCYGRVYKNPVQGQKGVYIPEAYLAEGNYRDVLLDDRYAVTSFFGIGDTTTMDTASNTVPVHIVFFVNLERIEQLPTRGDLQARDRVEAILDQDMYGFTLTSIATRLEVVLAEYSMGRVGQESTLRYADMHPFHAFRCNGTIRYSKPTFN